MAQGLGRGLGSLIPKKTVSYGENPYQDNDSKDEKKEVIYDSDRILQISPDKIDMNPFQPRTYFSDVALNDLAQSIKEHGLLQPIVVTKKEDGRFELIAGERRLRSSKLIGMEKISAIVRTEDSQKKLEFALIENLQRENLNPVETARAYSRLMEEFNITQEEVSRRVGKARSSVANSLRLLSLPQEIQDALSSGKISEAHAKQILSIDDKDKQVNMLRKIIRHNLTVSEAGREIKRVTGNNKDKVEKDYFDKPREIDLSKLLDTKVKIKRSNKGGQVVINFYNEDDLDGLINKIKSIDKK